MTSGPFASSPSGLALLLAPGLARDPYSLYVSLPYALFMKTIAPEPEPLAEASPFGLTPIH